MTDTVYVSKAHKRATVYHTNRDCGTMNDDPTEWSREDAEAMNYDLCKVCDEGRTGGTNGGRTPLALREVDP